jgi:hypothetical protein
VIDLVNILEVRALEAMLLLVLSSILELATGLWLRVEGVLCLLFETLFVTTLSPLTAALLESNCCADLAGVAIPPGDDLATGVLQ